MLFYKLVDDFLETKGSRELGLNALGRRSCVPASTLRRIVTREMGQPPHFKTAAAILGSIASREQAIEALRELYPEIMRSMENIYTRENSTSAPGPDELSRLHRHLERRVSCRVVHLCATRAGTTREEIRALMGASGIAALEALIDDDLVTEAAGGSLRLCSPNFSIANVEVARSVSVTFAEDFNLANLGTDAALLGQMSETVSAEGLAQIKQIMLRCLREVNAVRDNPKFIGPHAFYISLLLNTLNDVPLPASAPRKEQSHD